MNTHTPTCGFAGQYGFTAFFLMFKIDLIFRTIILTFSGLKTKVKSFLIKDLYFIMIFMHVIIHLDKIYILL